MTNHRLRLLAIASLMLLPELAHAQRIPEWLVLAVLSPLVVILLAVILGFLTRNGRQAAAHAGLVLVWVALFAVAANSFDNDYIIWTPLVFYSAHALFILLKVVLAAVRRFRSGDSDS